MHDAGGFSYKSMRTLRELFPLLNFGCKYCQIAHTKNIYERYGFEFENLARKKGYSVYHSDITATRKYEKMRDEQEEKGKVIKEKVNSL